MGLGVAVAIDRRVDEELGGSAADVRVSQSLDDATAFQVRFETDIVNGDLGLLDDDRLMPGREFSVLVDVQGKLQCIAHGLIESRMVHFVDGGPGSWVEVTGADRRVVMDREHRTRVWESGQLADIARRILDTFEFAELDIAETDIKVSPESHTLNQTSSDLEMVQKLARMHGFAFWVDCKVEVDRLGRLEVREVAHFRPSPERPTNPAGLPIPQAKLVPDDAAKELRMNTLPPENSNCSLFEVEVDFERPTQVVGSRVAQDRVEEQGSDVFDSPLDTLGEGESIEDAGPGGSTLLPAPGDANEHRVRAEAALLEAAWFVRAKARTSKNLMGTVLQAHEVISVRGVGKLHTGPYFVSRVDHAIDSSTHAMDVELLSNQLGEG